MTHIPNITSQTVMDEITSRSYIIGYEKHKEAVETLAADEDLSTKTASDRVGSVHDFIDEEYDKRTMALKPCSLNHALKHLCIGALIGQLKGVVDVKHLAEQDAELETLDIEDLEEWAGSLEEEDFGGFA